MQFSKLNIALGTIIEDANLLLIDVMPYYEYNDGKKTENLLGYKYTVAEDKTFDKFSVKVPSTVPAITKEQLERSKERIRVTFENGYAKPYRTVTGDYDLSFNATGINIIK